MLPAYKVLLLASLNSCSGECRNGGTVSVVQIITIVFRSHHPQMSYLHDTLPCGMTRHFASSDNYRSERPAQPRPVIF